MLRCHKEKNIEPGISIYIHKTRGTILNIANWDIACAKTSSSAKKKCEKNVVMNMKENPNDVHQRTKAKSGVSYLKDSQQY